LHVFTLLTYPVHLFSVHTRTLVEYLHIHNTWNMHLNDGLYIDPKRRRPDVLFWGSVPWPALDPTRAYGLILNIVDKSSLAAWWIFWLDMVWLISPQKPGYDTLLGNCFELLLWLWSTEGLNFNYIDNINNLWFLWGMMWVRGPFLTSLLTPAYGRDYGTMEFSFGPTNWGQFTRYQCGLLNSFFGDFMKHIFRCHWFALSIKRMSLGFTLWVTCFNSVNTAKNTTLLQRISISPCVMLAGTYSGCLKSYLRTTLGTSSLVNLGHLTR
jgi:hypothetical protein